MKIGVLSDIHSNLEALTAALEALDGEGVDEILCCGDIVGYGPQPNECIELLKQHHVIAVQGNHDAATLFRKELSRLNKAARRAINWTRKRLSMGSRAFLAQLATIRRIELGGRPISLVHGSPVDPLWGYILRQRDAYLAFRLDQHESYLQLFGHTHIPALFALKGDEILHEPIREDRWLRLEGEQRYLINPGSVGQPRDGDWRASICILELERSGSWRVRFRRLEYDVERTRREIQHAGLPEELGNRLLSGV